MHRVAEGNTDLNPEQTQLLHQNGLDLGQPQLSSVPSARRPPETSLQHLLEPKASVRFCPPLSACCVCGQLHGQQRRPSGPA